MPVPGNSRPGSPAPGPAQWRAVRSRRETHPHREWGTRPRASGSLALTSTFLRAFRPLDPGRHEQRIRIRQPPSKNSQPGTLARHPATPREKLGPTTPKLVRTLTPTSGWAYNRGRVVKIRCELSSPKDGELYYHHAQRLTVHSNEAAFPCN